MQMPQQSYDKRFNINKLFFLQISHILNYLKLIVEEQKIYELIKIEYEDISTTKLIIKKVGLSIKIDNR